MKEINKCAVEQWRAVGSSHVFSLAQNDAKIYFLLLEICSKNLTSTIVVH